MSNSWVSLLIIWGIVEWVQSLRKVPFPQRMVAPLIFAAVAAGLMSVGYAPPESDPGFSQFLVGALVGGAAGSIFYVIRILLVKILIENSATQSEAENSRSEGKLLLVLKKASMTLIVVAVGIGSATWLREKYKNHQYQQERAAWKALNDSVEIKAFRPEEGVCTNDFPYVYYVKNNSKKIVNSVHFNVYVRKVGFSGVLNNIRDYPEFRPDKILNPGDYWSQCFRVNVSGYPYTSGYVTDKDVEIEIADKQVYFREH